MQEKKYKTCYLFYTSFLEATLNVLPNSAGDLNVNKSPSVSKSSTFDIIPDSFSSFDKNFFSVEQL